jgi:hypothetical protein
VVVDAHVDGAVGEAVVASALADDQKRGRLAAAAVTPGSVTGKERLEQALPPVPIMRETDRRWSLV